MGRIYDGTITMPNGLQYTVDKSADTGKINSGLQRDAGRTATGSEGNVPNTWVPSTTGSQTGVSTPNSRTDQRPEV